MLKHSDEAQQGERPEIRALFERLSADGRSWAEAELELAKVEIGELKRQAVKALVLAVLALAAVFCSLVVLCQAGIALLTPHVGSAGLAALILGGVLMMAIVLLLLGMRRALSWRTESIFFRWFGHSPSSGARS